MRFDLQGIVRAAVAAAVRGNFSLRDCHGGTCSNSFVVSATRTRLAVLSAQVRAAPKGPSFAGKARPIAEIAGVARGVDG